MEDIKKYSDFELNEEVGYYDEKGNLIPNDKIKINQIVFNKNKKIMGKISSIHNGIPTYKKTNESTIEIEDTEEGVYVLTLHDVHNIVNQFTDTEISEEAILEELESYKFVKVEDAELTPVENSEVEPVKELSSDDENPLFIKKFEES